MIGCKCLAVLATEGIAVDKIRVVLADDHREVIAKIRGILGDDFDVHRGSGEWPSSCELPCSRLILMFS